MNRKTNMSSTNSSSGQSVSLQPGQSIRPILSKEYARKIVTSVFGLNVITIKEYNSYDDRNFHVIVDDKLWDNPYIKHIRPEGYMLKILNSMDSKKFHYGKLCFIAFLVYCFFVVTIKCCNKIIVNGPKCSIKFTCMLMWFCATIKINIMLV